MIEFSPSAVATWGSAFVFLNVLVTRLGVPIPAVPALLFAGSAIAGGTLSFPAVLLAAVLGALTGDAVWFALGRIYGRRLLAALARFAPALHRKVGRARALFERFGVPLVSISKFVPGLALITPPLMGTTAVDVRIYAAWDVTGAVLWASFWLLGGEAAEKQLHRLLTVVRAQGGTVIDMLVIAALGYLIWRMAQRRRARRRHALDHAAAPANGDEAGRPPIVLDARPQRAPDGMHNPHDPHDPHKPAQRPIPGAITLDPDAPEQIERALRACEHVVYCVCENHAAASAVIQRMRRHGFTRIRALPGVLDAWQRRGFPVEPRASSWSERPPAAPAEPASARRERPAKPPVRATDSAVTLRGLAPRRKPRA